MFEGWSAAFYGLAGCHVFACFSVCFSDKFPFFPFFLFYSLDSLDFPSRLS